MLALNLSDKRGWQIDPAALGIRIKKISGSSALALGIWGIRGRMMVGWVQVQNKLNHMQR
jgi:hypothetical protein